MLIKSIRWRLQAWHAALLVAVLAGFGATAYGLASATQFRGVDDELLRRIPPLNRVLEEAAPRPPGPGEGWLDGPPEGSRGAPPRNPPQDRPQRDGPDRGLDRPGPPDADFSKDGGYYYQIWWRDGRTLAKSAHAPLQLAPTGWARPGSVLIRTREGLREAIHRTPPGEILLVGRSVAPEMAALRRLAWGLAAAGATVLAAGLAGGSWVAGRALRPLRDISAAAREIAAGDLARRIPAADTDTELGQLATVLNATFARLEAAFAQQGRFTADASHELRTPVAVLLAQTQAALARERAPEEYRAALDTCRRAAERMRRLLDSLLELARFDAGQEPLRAGPMNLADTAAEALDMVRPLAAGQSVTLRSELPAAPCHGDPDRLLQVASNLLTNAVRFNRPGGEVTVSVGRGAAGVFLRVEDTGVGIAPEDLPRLFERFYRADPSRSRETGSNGLGLSIAKAVAEAHGGRIDATSIPGKGSVFTLWLPGT